MSVAQAWSASRCAGLLPKAKRTPEGFKACCPAHEDSDPSLFLADGHDGGLVLVCYAGCSYRSIAEALEARGAQLPGTRASSAEAPPVDHFQLGAYSSHWDYRDARGRLVMRVCRWEQPGGKKDIRPIIRTQDGWKWAHHPTPRPLYQLDRLANEPAKPVLIVEGEKAAAAAQKLFPAYVVTTWPGGAQSVGQADWSPLKDRAVTLVPDYDIPGAKAMAWVAQHLRGIAADCRIVNPVEKAGDLPEGWDFADAAAEGRDVSGWLAEADRPRTIRRLGEILASPSRPRWLIRDVLEEGVIALMCGARGAYKSFIATHWAMSIAVEGAPVVLVSAEGAGLDRRLRAWLLKHAPSVDPATLPVYAIERRVNFNDDASTTEFLKDFDGEELKPALIVIDTFSKNSGALDENSNSEVKAFIGRLDAMLRRRYGATVLLVHHTGHNEKGRARGASALEADTDAAYVITRAADKYLVTVSRERFKDGPELAPLTYRAELIPLGELEEDGRPVASLALTPTDAATVATERRGGQPRGLQQRQLLRRLKDLQTEHDSAQKAPGESSGSLTWTASELRGIARDCGMSKQTAQDACAALAAFYLVPAVGGYRLRRRSEE